MSGSRGSRAVYDKRGRYLTETLQQNTRQINAKNAAIRARRSEAGRNAKEPTPDVDARIEQATWTAPVCPRCFLTIPCDCDP